MQITDGLIINLLCIIVLIIGTIYGILIYIKTKKLTILGITILFILSAILEFQRINDGYYLTLSTGDAIRTFKDILWTILLIFLMKLVYKK